MFSKYIIILALCPSNTYRKFNEFKFETFFLDRLNRKMFIKMAKVLKYEHC